MQAEWQGWKDFSFPEPAGYAEGGVCSTLELHTAVGSLQGDALLPALLPALDREQRWWCS